MLMVRTNEEMYDYLLNISKCPSCGKVDRAPIRERSPI